MKSLKNSFQNILYYPSAIVGMLVVFLLVFTAVYAIVKIPYNEAIRLWRGGEEVWYQNPKFAPPTTTSALSFTSARVFGKPRWTTLSTRQGKTQTISTRLKTWSRSRTIP